MATTGDWLANPNSNAAGLPVVAGTATGFSGGESVFQAVASAWNGATVALQMLSPDGATWQNCGAATTLTANGNGYVILPRGQVRVNVTGGTPTGLFANVSRIAKS